MSSFLQSGLWPLRLTNTGATGGIFGCGTKVFEPPCAARSPKEGRRSQRGKADKAGGSASYAGRRCVPQSRHFSRDAWVKRAGRFHGPQLRLGPHAGPLSRRGVLPVPARCPPPEPDQREMPERRHRRGARSRARRRAARPMRAAAPSGIPAASRAGAPPARSPARTARRSPASAPMMIDQDDLAAGLEHARELVERRLRVGHRGDDVLRHHHVEGGVGKAEMLRRPSPPAPRHWRACARRRARAPCAASARNSRRRRCGCCGE